MKLRHLLAIILLAVATLTACGEAPAESAPPAQPQLTNAETIYLGVLRAQDNTPLAHASDQVLLDAGWNICIALDDGYTVQDIVVGLIQANVVTDTQGAQAAGFIIGAAVTSLCPQYNYLV